MGWGWEIGFGWGWWGRVCVFCKYIFYFLYVYVVWMKKICSMKKNNIEIY